MVTLWVGTDREDLTESLGVLEIHRLDLVGQLAYPYVKIHWMVQFDTQEMSDQKLLGDVFW